MRKLTIVVTCTDRKTTPPDRPLMIRSLRGRSLPTRTHEWAARMAAPGRRYPLHSLYQGAAWTETTRLVESGRRSGYSVRLLVASAGLGLRFAESEAPSYSATFSPGHEDSVASETFTTGDWWRAVRQLDHALDPKAELRGRVLLVLSSPYARAMSADLEALGQRGDDVLLFGGAATVAGIARIPSDLALRTAVGGSAISLNLRMAQTWLQRFGESPDLYTDKHKAVWERWAQRVREVQVHRRTQITDAEVRAFVLEQLTLNTHVSATAALRQLRTAGLACEQKRFGNLFRQVATSA